MLTEHGQTEDLITNTRLVNYSLVSAFCREDNIKGGVAIFKHIDVDNEIKSLNVESRSILLIIEVSAISVKVNKKTNLNILGVYGPPKNNKEFVTLACQTLSSILHHWSSSNNINLIIGDINVDSLKQFPENAQLIDTLTASNFERINLPPTRITNQTQSSIDMVCISSSYKEKLQVHVIPTGISDHTGQTCEVNLEVSRKVPAVESRRIINNRNIIRMAFF